MRMFLEIVIGLCSLIGIVFGILYSYWVLYGILAIFGKGRKYPETEERPVYGFLICARNEAAVIKELIESIRGQDYPKEKIRIFVMADNCTDDTAQLAREAGADRVYERFNRELVGKGYALQALFEHLRTEPGASDCRGFFIFDADNLLDPEYTMEMNKAVCSGHRIVNGFRQTKNWGDSIYANCLGLHHLRESFQLNRARTMLGSDTMVAGTGWYIDKTILEEEGGWNYTEMTEDSQFSAAQMLKGEHIFFCEQAVFYDEQVVTRKQMDAQRKRWAKGTIQVCDRYGKEMLRTFFQHRFMTSWDYFGNFFGLKYMSPLGLISIVLGALAGVLVLYPNRVAMLITLPSVLISLYFSFFFQSVFPMLFAWKQIPLPFWDKIRTYLFFPFYHFGFMVISFDVLFLHRNVGWVPISHQSKTRTIAKPPENRK